MVIVGVGNPPPPLVLWRITKGNLLCCPDITSTFEIYSEYPAALTFRVWEPGLSAISICGVIPMAVPSIMTVAFPGKLKTVRYPGST